jgi:cytochrome c
MMLKPLAALACLAALATPALADGDGDAAKGEADFKKCRACHAIVGADGTEIQKGGKVGPNLFGVVGRTVGSLEDFKYGESIVAVGAAGTVWDQENLEDYLKDPTAWLKEVTGDSGAKSKMTFKLAKGGEDMAAYLASLSAE